MDTCREIPDPELWLRIGSRCIGSRVRNASRLVGRQPALLAGGQGACCPAAAGKNASPGRLELLCSTRVFLLNIHILGNFQGGDGQIKTGDFLSRLEVVCAY